MRCPECNADVPALREFCPNCGTAMDRDLRESLRRGRGQRPVEEQRSNRKTFLIGGAAILIALGVAGKLSLPDVPISIDFDDRDRSRGPVTIEADQLYQAYRDDPDAAAKRFGGREMMVSGEFVRIVPDGYGSLDLRLKTSNPDAQLGIDVAQLAIEDAKRLRPGQRVTVSCQRMGSGGEEFWVQDCAIQPVAEGSAAPAPPTSPAPPPAPGEGNSG